MKITITQTGTRRFTDVYEFNLDAYQVRELAKICEEDDRTLADVYEGDLYELGFQLYDPITSEDGEMLDDEIELVVEA